MSCFFKQKNLIFLKNQTNIHLSFAMQQSLDVLQMPLEELSCWLQKQIEQNPMMEWDEADDRKLTSSSQTIFVEREIPYAPSLFEYLMGQARQEMHDPRSLQQMEWIIGNLDPTGFFTTSFETAPVHWDRKQLKQLLAQLQQFDPPGIGARTLQESLLLQLKARGKENSPSYFAIENHLDDLLQGKLFLLQGKYPLEAIFQDVASLDPFPGLRFQKHAAAPIIPDLFLVQEDEQWSLKVNGEILPLYYIKSLPQGVQGLQEEEASFLRKCQREAKWISEAIQKRQKTLQVITEYIVQVQQEYLIQAQSKALCPLTVQEIAQKTSLHESTITRALSGKYLSCDLGILPLKSLLSKSLRKDLKHISSDQAHKLLQKLILEEDKKDPLSDQKLLEKMKQIGIPCSRRTVTKYRSLLQIPSRRFRRKAIPTSS